MRSPLPDIKLGSSKFQVEISLIHLDQLQSELFSASLSGEELSVSCHFLFLPFSCDKTGSDTEEDQKTKPASK